MSRSLDLRVGIDVGGTNTDAVALDRDDTVMASVKVPTTDDVTSGIEQALSQLIGTGAFDSSRVSHVMLGTTHATNAVLQRRGLGRVAVVRIGAPATAAVPPLSTWPDDLREAVSVGEIIVPGGIEIDGNEIVPFDPSSLKGFLGPLLGRVEAIAVVSVFAPVSDRHERLAEAAIRQMVSPDLPILLSSEVASLGLLERENATVLNGALMKVARHVTEALDRALVGAGINALTYFSQNDGTLMSLDYVHRYPVLTIGSGPANSMRGAAYLSRLSDAIIADVGGTSTDIGVLVGGFPRTSSLAVEIGGVKTNFRMPDLISIALGGGTIIQQGKDGIRIGPESVGYRLTRESVVFGGSTPTLTDAAVACGRASLGTHPPDLDPAITAAAIEWADRELAEAVDRMRTSLVEQPLVVVGGGSILVPEHIAGVSAVLRPPLHDVANAIGAAIASVSGQIDRLFDVTEVGRDRAVEEASRLAVEEAVRLGADANRTEVVDVEEFNVLYVSTTKLRIRAKAAGPLAEF